MFENLQGFFESTTGQVITVLVMLLFFAWILIPMGKEKQNRSSRDTAKVITLSAILIALGMILGQIKVFEMPQGGSVTAFSMLPIALCAYLLGTRRGVMAGICLGLLNLIFGPYVIHPVQMLIDYPLAFGAMGLGGFFRSSKHGLIKVYLTGLVGRYLCAVLSGIIFFGAYAPEGFNAVTWSLWYNITYLGVEGLITTALLCIPQVSQLFNRIKMEYRLPNPA